MQKSMYIHFVHTAIIYHIPKAHFGAWMGSGATK